MRQHQGVTKAQTHGRFMNKMKGQAKTSLWVGLVKSGLEKILQLGRITSEDSKRDLQGCITLLEEENYCAFRPTER